MTERFPPSEEHDYGNEKSFQVMEGTEVYRTAELVNGTLEKSEAIKDLVAHAVGVVEYYFSSQGLAKSFSVDELLSRVYMIRGNEVHLRTSGGEDIRFPLYAASYDPLRNQVYIKEDTKSLGEVFIFRVLIHEFVHMHQRTYLRAFRDRSGKINVQRRGGYQLETFVYEGGEVVSEKSGQLGGLNEAMTDFIAIRAMEASDALNPRLLSDLWRDSYLKEKRVFQAIIMKIAQVEQKNIAEIEREFLTGYVIGTMMHLRRVERYFGPQSLQILAFLGTLPMEEPESQIKHTMIVQYFESEDSVERERISQTLFAQEGSDGSIKKK